MPNWLKSISDVLDNAEQPVRLFFRDDDAGWANDRLYALLDTFAQFRIPIDLAVIPEALDHTLVDELLSRQQAQQLIGLHQHGYSHTNHEPIGRKCEFGSNRNKNQQKTDIEMGQIRLHEALGSALDPIFTPPWNRCTRDTVACLEELDFRLLSRDVTASELESATLQQVPVHVNWSRMLDMPLSELSLAIADNLKNNELTGIMLHHADMDNENLKPLAELLAVLADHNNAHGLLLRELLG
jgi:predicted deacetylase